VTLLKSRSWKDIAEIVGITAIVVSLLVLALEVNQNTQALRAEAIQRSTEIGRQQVLMFAQDEDVTRIAMETDLSNLTEVERQRSFWIRRSFMLGMQGLYRQWSMGVLPDVEWEFWTGVICSNTRNPTFEENWRPESLIPEFVQYVQGSCMSDDLSEE
jgi:hypothetical protein